MRSAVVIALTGCCLLPACSDPPQRLFEPSIGTVTVANTVQGAEPTVTAQIIVPGGSDLRVQSATLQFRSTREPDRPFVSVAQPMTSAAGGATREGSLPALNYGPYEVEVTAILRVFDPADPTPQAEDVPLTKTQAFFVSADEKECFNFTSDLQGWSFDGFYDGEAGPASQCPDPIAHLAANQGTAAVLVPSSCFPALEAASGAFRFDFVSPDVTSRPGWATTEGLLVSADANFPLRVVPILMVSGGAVGEIVSTNQHPLESPTIAFQDIVQPLSVPEDAAVSAARVRVLVEDPVLAGAEGLVQVGTVCPIPQRPG